jgi:hypothetical protein
VTLLCGWEVDDIVRWLEDTEGMFDSLVGVERKDAFAATLSFGDEQSAQRLSAALRTDEVPEAMRHALVELKQESTSVSVRFEAVAEVNLTDRGAGHVAACILEEDA